MPSLIREKRNYTPRQLQEIAGLYWQEQGRYPWDWSLRVLDQEDSKRRLDKQVLLSGGHFLIPWDFPYRQGLQETE